MHLQSHSKFDEIAQFDKATGKVNLYSKSENSRMKSTAPNGLFSRINGKICILYRDGESLFFRFGGTDYEITKGVRSSLSRVGSELMFALEERGSPALEIRYQPPELIVNPEHDLTPFADYEDFDFLYFVHKVLNDPIRMAAVFR